MKRYAPLLPGVFFCGLIALSFLGCNGARPTGVPSGGDVPTQIIVFVHWQEQGVPGHEVEIVETGATAVTDEFGRATFAVPPGDYTVRVFGLNWGGPALRSVDFPVRVGADDVQVEVVDCLPCV